MARKSKLFWPCPYCGKEVWGHLGIVIPWKRRRQVYHLGCHKQRAKRY